MFFYSEELSLANAGKTNCYVRMYMCIHIFFNAQKFPFFRNFVYFNQLLSVTSSTHIDCRRIKFACIDDKGNPIHLPEESELLLRIRMKNARSDERLIRLKKKIFTSFHTVCYEIYDKCVEACREDASGA